MMREINKIISVISVAGDQLVKNLSKPSETNMVRQDFYANYLQETISWTAES